MSQQRWIMGMLMGVILGAGGVEAACPPTRDNTYVKGAIIQTQDVTANEDNLYNALANGITTDCLANDAVTTAKIATGAVTSSDILDGTITTADLAFSVTGTTLPSGAVYFLLTGSCPAGTTDVSSTYEGSFLQVSATQGTTGGDSTHTHTPGSLVGPVHTHTVPRDSWGSTDVGTSGRIATAENSGAGNALSTATADNVTGSGGGGAITGTSASASSLPTFISMKLCKVQ